METDIVTIDGPTSSGKNSVGFLLAKKLGYQYIDTGMIYRAGTYLVLKNNISVDDVQRIANTFKTLKLEIRSSNGGLVIYNDGEDLTEKLHTKEVTDSVPIVSAIRQVREETKIIQRNLGRSKKTVMTGRDIGSEIFPDAKHKFFLTARDDVRARRRYEQLVKKDPSIKYEDVFNSMIERDKKDTTRKVSPLRIPQGAIIIDNSDLTVEQTVDKMLEHIKKNASA